ncbi:MAG: hypothetical protein L3J65_10235 [Robiginitomaculum sp.]|nr:hypothetical protein [Robiginitomaculum sp.]
MKKIILTCAIVPLLLQACASSPEPQQREKSAPPAFGKNQSVITVVSPASLLITSFNRNNDYVIDRAEFTAGRDQAFLTADSNQDGRINLFEMDAWRQGALGSKDAAPMSMFFDADFNQVVTKKEFETAFDTLFNNADKDGNSTIAFTELVRVAARPSGRSQGKKPAQSKQKKRGQGKGGGRGQHSY